MRKIRLILAFIIIAVIISSPCYALEWALTYGGSGWDHADCIRQTADGGYVMSGYTNSFETAGRCWVLKLNADGTIAWQKTYGGPVGGGVVCIDEAFNQGTPDGYIVTCGPADAMGDFGVLRLNLDGTIAWHKLYYYGNAFDRAYDIKQTSDEGYIVSGYTESFPDGSGRAWILKLNANGTVAWENTYGGPASQGAVSIAETFDQGSPDGYIVAGGPIGGGPGSGPDGFEFGVLRLNIDGTKVWEKTYGGFDHDTAFAIRQVFDQGSPDGYIVVGSTQSFGATGRDVWILKLNADGSIGWEKRYDRSTLDIAAAVEPTANGGYLVAGLTEDGFGYPDVWVLKLNSTGTVAWQKTYGGSNAEFANSVSPTADGGCIIAGITGSFGAGSNDAWILKLDTNGEISGCSAMGTSQATVSDTSAVVTDIDWDPYATSADIWDVPWIPDDTYAGRSLVCGVGPALSIRELVPSDNGYGTNVKVKGGDFGDQRTGMLDQLEGYFSFVTFSGAQTLIGTKYPAWSATQVKVKFRKLFVDADGDFLQDGNEPFVSMEGLSLSDHVLRVNTIWFEDLNMSGTYDEGDNITASESSNPMLFTDPVIYALIPNPTPASATGNPAKVKIKGLNFGETQSASKLHIGGKTWSQGHPKIKIWEDDKIKFKVPKYDSPFPKYKEVWVTVNGIDSNKVMLEITAP